MPSEGIAESVLKAFDNLPTKSKPRILPNGRREWVPLAGIVLTRGRDVTSPPSLTCAALATGMKCLPQAKIPQANGCVLHDWHAEVLAIRSFNRFLVDECAELARQGIVEGEEQHHHRSQWVRWRNPAGSRCGDLTNEIKEDNAQAFALQPDVRIHMYCSEAPCGDASMELTMAAQADATPWETEQAVGDDGLLGRGNFDQLGIVRRKPSRPDAPQSLSKSCSDKLALKQCTGLLSGLASLLIHPQGVYLSTLVLPESQYVETAAHRAFGARGRMKAVMREDVQSRWRERGYSFRPFEVQTTKKEFEFSKRAAEGAVPSNLSVMWTPRRREILINGVLQGRKQLDARGASCVSRRLMWKSVLDVALLAGLPALTTLLKDGERTYDELKKSDSLKGRELVKRDTREYALQGWKRNQGGNEWRVDQES